MPEHKYYYDEIRWLDALPEDVNEPIINILRNLGANTAADRLAYWQTQKHRKFGSIVEYKEFKVKGTAEVLPFIKCKVDHGICFKIEVTKIIGDNIIETVSVQNSYVKFRRHEKQKN